MLLKLFQKNKILGKNEFLDIFGGTYLVVLQSMHIADIYSDTSFHFSSDGPFFRTLIATGNVDGDRISLDFCSEAFLEVREDVLDSF